MRFFSHILYLLTAAALALAVPAQTISTSSRLFIVVGIVGFWRYSWLLINLGRAILYAVSVYPRMKRKARARYEATSFKPHAYFLVTSYRIEAEITRSVFRALFAAAANSPAGATVVASIVEESDEREIRTLYEECVDATQPVKLAILRIAGTGKRDALACGLDAIVAMAPDHRDLVLLVDGDSCVPSDILARSAPFFSFDSRVGALTTDETCIAQGSGLFRDWFDLRFAQRQIMMCSMGLSRRVLTLTGRMSIFSARVAIDPDFIDHVQHDSIEHWRLGEVKFLTGDDKSTWFWLLRNGYHMLYLPDVKASAVETQPYPSFVASARVLMMRWYGNTMRNNGRALRLGPGQIGTFTWLAILDQRLSLWTALTGPAGAILGTLFVDPFILPLYASWAMATRYAACTILTLFRGEFPITYPFLLYFSQIYGAVLKARVFFRPDRQKWTRQNTVQAIGGGWLGRLRAFSSAYVHALGGGLLLTVVALLMGLIGAASG